jgi:predicted SAM-dependent methyltransferase
MQGSGAPVQCDLRTLTFADNSADRITSVHVLEHFFVWEAVDLLKEWRRVLRPGGLLALELPCMDKVFAYITNQYSKKQPLKSRFSILPIWGDPRYKDPAMMHKCGYFKHDMVKLLDAAGFDQIQNVPARYHFPERDMRWEARRPI